MAASAPKIQRNIKKSKDLSRRAPLAPKVDGDKLKRAIKAATNRVRKAVKSNDKAALKALHLRAKAADPLTDYENLRRLFSKLHGYFPQPARIEPSLIAPCVIPVTPDSLEEKLFKVARGYWSMPYSKGYGRRMRFLVMDTHHEAVIGILGLQSPSADLACRDQYLDVPREQKLSIVNNTLDAYTV